MFAWSIGGANVGGDGKEPRSNGRTADNIVSVPLWIPSHLTTVVDGFARLPLPISLESEVRTQAQIIAPCDVDGRLVGWTSQFPYVSLLPCAFAGTLHGNSLWASHYLHHQRRRVKKRSCLLFILPVCLGIVVKWQHHLNKMFLLFRVRYQCM